MLIAQVSHRLGSCLAVNFMLADTLRRALAVQFARLVSADLCLG
jgi:hypothetical protein